METNAKKWTIADGCYTFTVQAYNAAPRQPRCSCHARTCKHIDFLFPGRVGGPSTRGLKTTSKEEILLPRRWGWF